MNVNQTPIEGLYLIKTEIIEDKRGRFIKTFHKETFKNFELNVDFVESYYSISDKNVIRGMHFQVPPEDHNKLVYVPAGEIIDVILDIRKKSKTFGKFESFDLSSENGNLLYIPKGCAHGFLSLKDNTIVTYLQTTMYNKNCDKGIAYDSFGFNWNCVNPIISDRDKNFTKLNEYNSKF